MDQANTNEIGALRKWGSLAVLSLALAIIVIDTTIINVALKTIVKDLGTTVQTLQWVITGYALVVSAFTITGGRLGDLFGRKRMFIVGALTFAVGALTASTAHSSTQLVFGASVIEGLGAAMMLPATASLLLSTFHGRERAIAFGVWGGVAGAAASIGPILGGWLTSHYTWRYAYGINPIIVAVLLIFSWLVVEAREGVKKPTVDWVGIGLSALGLAAIVYGIVESSTYGWVKAKEPASFFGQAVNLGDYSIVIFALVFGLMLLVMFGMWQVIVESRGKTPLVSPHIVANTRFTAGVSTMAIVAMGQFGMFFTLPVFLQAVRGLDAFHTGLALLPFSLSVLLAAPISGIVGTRLIGAKRVVIIGLIIGAAGMLYLRHLITADATAHDILPALVVQGIGFGMAFAQLANITLSVVSVQEAGEASGINNTFRQLGATLGTAILGAILISSVQTNLTNGINDSQRIPAIIKQPLAAGVKTEVQSLGQDTGRSGTKLPPPVVNELTNLRNDAVAKGVRQTLAYGSGILAFGVLLSLRLPKSVGQTHGPAASAPDSAPATPAAESAAEEEAKPAPKRPPRKPVRL